MMHKTLLVPLAAAAALIGVFVPITSVQAAQSDWVVDAATAKKLIDADKATILDTRGKQSWSQGHVAGAQPVKWQDFCQTKAGRKGKLLADDGQLTRKLQTLGISKERRVIVVGKAPNNWGEDGRIVWMLRTLGHPAAALVSGGERALTRAGVDTTTKHASPKPGDFVAEHTGEFVIERDAFKAKLGGDDLVVIDTREAREYAGKTPYGETRGGHIPGAKHLFYQDLMRPDGRLLADAKLRKMLAAKSVDPDDTIVAYCTGGVRSGWLTAVLHDLGYTHAVNYAGSMWEWSASPAKAYPLVQ